MRSFVLLAAFLSATYAQVAPGTFGNAVCESDYGNVVQVLGTCGLKVSPSTGSVTFVEGVNNATLCLCQPDNVKTITKLKTSCSSVKQLEYLLSSTDVVTTECTAIANGSPLPEQPTGAITAIVPKAFIPKQCETAQNSILATWNKCGITYSANGVSVSNKQEAVTCICKNLNVVESAVTACEGVASFSSQRASYADLRKQCAQSGAASLRVSMSAVAVAIGVSLFL
ncbi:hypothetical protein BJ741DRAFT_709682 [Chytriomyces cf. hyalinus JEL632]|nr:hypothetical protein BJ741DRAFT_709682 [Chytriomyces cf. hyalinus JEL632]